MQTSETHHIFCYTVDFGLSNNAGVTHETYLLPGFQDTSSSPSSCILLFAEMIEYDGEKTVQQAHGFVADMFPEMTLPQYHYLQSYPWAPVDHQDVPAGLKEELRRRGLLGSDDEVHGQWSRAPIKSSFQVCSHLMMVSHVTEPTLEKMEKISQAMRSLTKKPSRVAQQ